MSSYIIIKAYKKRLYCARKLDRVRNIDQLEYSMILKKAGGKKWKILLRPVVIR